MAHHKISIEDIIHRMKTVLGVTMDKDVADYYDVARSQVSAWKSRGRIPFDECIRLAEQFDVSLDWLVFGRGHREVRPATLREVPADPAGSAEPVPRVDPDPPCLVPLRAFCMQPWEELDIDAWWSVPLGWLQAEGLDVHETIMVRGWGDTMAGTIAHGDMVVVDRRPHNGDGVYLVQLGEVMRFKRVQHMVDGTVRLSCDDQAYEAETITAWSDLTVMGYCHAIVKRVK